MNRILGKKNGGNKRPLFIILCGIHGNEPVGISTVEKIFVAIEKISIEGTIVGIVGNIKACSKGVRFIEHDLNRLFLKKIIETSRDQQNPTNEYAELIELIDCIKNEIAQTQPEKIFLIDVHSTSAESPLFSIVNNDKSTWEIAGALHVPVVTGLSRKLSGGSTLEYFTSKNFNVPMCCISIEAGQHKNPIAVQRAFNFIVKMLEYTGIVQKSVIELYVVHEEVQNLPRLVKFAYRHAINKNTGFVMNWGYKSFQKIKKGEVLGSDKNGSVISPQDGYMLMPLYQAQGNDGFFLVEEIP